LCNGSNSTPDLRDRFVIGAGSTYAVGDTGGSANAIVVSHTHTATVTDSGHSHSYNDVGRDNFIYGSTSGPDFNSTNAGTSTTTGSAVTGISVTNSTTGASGTNANLPPYYALCYIMKT
jgi:hypothetical protein